MILNVVSTRRATEKAPDKMDYHQIIRLPKDLLI
jgi:hypothetical protein